MNQFGGRDFSAASRLAFSSLNAHEQEINHLNVFPVPDGDTGLNMSRTLAPVLSLPEEAHLGKASLAASEAILRASRGNSGTILATFFLGLSKAFKGMKSADSAALVAAFKRRRDRELCFFGRSFGRHDFDRDAGCRIHHAGSEH